MTPHLPAFHVGAGLSLCTQHWGQGSSPVLLVLSGLSTECFPPQHSCDLGNSGFLTHSDGHPLLLPSQCPASLGAWLSTSCLPP